MTLWSATLLLALFCFSVCAQNLDDLIDDVFRKPSTEENASQRQTSTSAPDFNLQPNRGGEDTDIPATRDCTCIAYYLCKNGTIIGNGEGIIDIRFGENSCSHPLEVCCKLPKGGLDPNLPLPGDDRPTPPTVPPVTPTVPFTPFPVVTPPTPQNPSYCGLRNPNGIDFKIDGAKDHEAEYGEFPWMAAILNRNLNPSLDPNFLVCGGSLITPNVVLTGAHCVNRAKSGDLTVRLGEWDTQTTRERLPYQERSVINILSRNDFNPGTLYNDLALLILDRPVDKADNVATICLPVQGQRINSKNCFVSGWGKDVFGKKGKAQAIMKKIELPTVKRQTCQDALRKTRLGQSFNLHSSFICAGGEEGKDACTGDGGSPLTCPDPNNPGRYVQVGIVGWGIGCGMVGVPGVYTDVAKFRSWIDEQMERLNFDIAPYNV